jgi:hypothetical protein
MPDPLFDAAEKLAEKLGVSRSELYQQALRRYLKSYSHDVIREKLDEVYGADGESSRLDPVIEYLQFLSLPEDDWS